MGIIIDAVGASLLPINIIVTVEMPSEPAGIKTV